ncbi:MAG TPA: glutathione S-transferase family protein [Polyangiales bacterium]|nr:glutathione S-transferase family protein [Polyangiales bacterium]
MNESAAILNTFAVSHFCESARWTLDYKGVDYSEESWAPLLHVTRTWRMKRTYTPILRIDGEVLQESAAICEYIEERFPEPNLIPKEHRDDVLRLADEARSIGPHVRRMAYHAIGQSPEQLEQAWALNLPSREAKIQQLVFPLTRRMAFKAMKIDEAHAKKSEQFVREYLADRDTWFATGRKYLVGERFTLADLTLAAMLSPLARPTEHPFYPRMDLGAASEALIESFRGYRLLDWVRRCYAEHRARR